MVGREASAVAALPEPCYAPPYCLVKVVVTGKDTEPPLKLLKIGDVHEFLTLKGLMVVRSVVP
jgi:hypothetical protein